jgi:ABC-2 type transport system permease protein
LLLARSPLGFFITLVVPVLLLVCLNLLTPDPVAALPGGLGYAQFLTPAIGTFCLLNACYVATITGLVQAREEGVLKRLRGTPLATWAYLFGRFGSALVTALAGLTVITTIAVLFFDVTIVWDAFGYLLGVTLLGVVCFFLLGVAVVSLVPKSETALPVAYGTMLPLAFISDVFFSSSHAPAWLYDLASALPVAPIARAMEASFNPGTTSWPMSATALFTTAAWSTAALVLIAVGFRWAPGPIRWPRRTRPRRSRDQAQPPGQTATLARPTSSTSTPPASAPPLRQEAQP